MTTTPDADKVATFRCDIVRVEDHTILVLRGEIDIVTAPALTREAIAALDRGAAGLTIDLSYLGFLDSSGVRALLEIRAEARDRGIALRLESVPRQVRTVLNTCGVAGLFGLD